MKLSLFKKAQHKTFTHIPIYYNERDERIKELEAKAKSELENEQNKDYHQTIKGSMRKYAHQHQSATHFAQKEKRRSNLRVIIILSLLFLVAYLLWQYTDTFVEAFIKG